MKTRSEDKIELNGEKYIKSSVYEYLAKRFTEISKELNKLKANLAPNFKVEGCDCQESCMKVYLEIDEQKVKELVFEYVCNILNVDTLKTGDVKIEVKSKQNYKSE